MRAFLWILPVSLAIATAAPAGAAQEADSPVYIVAPEPAAARSANLLPYEAALRTVGVVLASHGATIVYVPRDQLHTPSAEAFPRIAFDFDDGKRAMVLYEGEGPARVLTEGQFETDSWAGLVSGVADAAERAVYGMGKLPRFTAGAPGDEGAGKLAQALQLLVEDGPTGAGDAADLMEEVLADGAGAEALWAASMPASCLASVDLYGHFQYRDRVLAVPVSFAAAAKLAEKDRTPGKLAAQAKLAEAWAALVCGFPAESLALVKDAGELDGAAAKLAAALEVWALRDWRRYEPAESPPPDEDSGGEAGPADESHDGPGHPILKATAVEQLAWLWAIQYCDIFDLYVDEATSILYTRNSCAFAPLFDVHTVGSGRRLTPIMIGVSFRDAVASALMDARVPVRLRAALLSGYTGRRVAAQEDAVMKAARTVCTRLAEGLYGDEPDAAAVELLWNATDLLLSSPSGPVVDGDWRVLEPWFVGQVVRGAALQTLQLRADLLENMWGVPKHTRRYMAAVAAGTDEHRDHGTFLRMLELWLRRDEKPFIAEAKQAFKGEIGVQPCHWWLYSTWKQDNWIENTAKNFECEPHPVGAYQGRMRLSTKLWAERKDPSDDTRALYESTVRHDPRNYVRGYAAAYENLDAAEALRLAAELADNRAILWRMFSISDDDEFRADIGHLTIERHPRQLVGYTSLADVYCDRGDNAKAIEVLEEGVAAAEWSVRYSNVEARLARLLLKEGRIDDALRHAEHASRSYSARALGAYAEALIADGQIEKGMEYRRKNALRYRGCVYEYLGEALDQGYELSQVVPEAEMLYERHDMGRSVLSIVSPFIVRGHFDAARELLNGVCKCAREGEKERFLGITDLVEGDFQSAAENFRRGMEGGFVDVPGTRDAAYSVVQAYIAMTLAGDDASREKAWKLISESKVTTGNEFEAMYKYIAGKVGRDEAIEMNERASQDNLVNLYWIFGAEDEAAGDQAAAIEWYRKAVAREDHRRRYAWLFAKRRLDALGAAAPPETEAAPAAAGQ